MIILETDDISEKQLAQIALAIHERWNVPTFVKMHEIVVMEDDLEPAAAREILKDFEEGIYSVFEYLDILKAFRLTNRGKRGKPKYSIERVPGSVLPQWMNDIESPPVVPEGVFVCPHCGRWFATDIELSMHTKIHYLM